MVLRKRAKTKKTRRRNPKKKKNSVNGRSNTMLTKKLDRMP